MENDISKLKGTFFEEIANAIGIPLTYVEEIEFATDDYEFVPALKKAGYELTGDCEEGWYLKGTNIYSGYDIVRAPATISKKDVAFISGLIDSNILQPKYVGLNTNWMRTIRVYRLGKGQYIYSKEDKKKYFEDLESIKESKKRFHEAGLDWETYHKL